MRPLKSVLVSEEVPGVAGMEAMKLQVHIDHQCSWQDHRSYLGTLLKLSVNSVERALFAFSLLL